MFPNFSLQKNHLKTCLRNKRFPGTMPRSSSVKYGVGSGHLLCLQHSRLFKYKTLRVEKCWIKITMPPNVLIALISGVWGTLQVCMVWGKGHLTAHIASSFLEHQLSLLIQGHILFIEAKKKYKPTTSCLGLDLQLDTLSAFSDSSGESETLSGWQ